MKRRTFLQLTGMTAAGTALAGCQSGNEKLIPFLVPPDEGVTPGEANYYASACRSCPAGCGILVRVAEGRARKIEGNPRHPVNRGKLCARGQAALQELYHPDRVTQPLKRSGPRGSGEFTKIGWEEALDLLTARLKDLQRQSATDRLTLLTPQLGGTLAEMTAGFMQAFGSPHLVTFEFLGPDWLRAAGRQSFDRPNLPHYDLAESRYLLSFGADFVDSHLSPVHYGYAFGRMRQARDTVRGHFTYVGGRMSLTGASADRWLPARPGSEGALALGMVKLMLVESLYDEAALAAAGLSAQGLRRQLDGYELPQVAEQTGLSPAAIAEVAREFAATHPALAMAGETVAFQSNGNEAVRAIQLLNLINGSFNRPGGIFPDAGTPEGPENSFAALSALIAAMGEGTIDTALIHGDPTYSVPMATGFQEALTKVPFVVSFSTLLDDTALQADLILPDHSALESWGDVIPLAGSRQPTVGLMQPVVTPLHDTRPFPELLLTVAGELGGATAAALPEESYPALLKKTMARRLGADPNNFQKTWVELLRQGGIFEAGEEEKMFFQWTAGSELPKPPPPRFAGEEKEFPLQLQVYSSTAFYDGRGAPLPWLQQLPDPMTTVVWDAWVEINPQTAAGLGIGFGDLVEVTSPRATLRLPAVLYPGIRPEMVAIPLGQGHRGGGRYTRGRGANPLELLCFPDGADKPQPSWNATRVRVRRLSEAGKLVTAGHPEGSYRSELIGI